MAIRYWPKINFPWGHCVTRRIHDTRIIVGTATSISNGGKNTYFWGPSVLVLLTSLLFMQCYLAPFLGLHETCIFFKERFYNSNSCATVALNYPSYWQRTVLLTSTSQFVPWRRLHLKLTHILTINTRDIFAAKSPSVDFAVRGWGWTEVMSDVHQGQDVKARTRDESLSVWKEDKGGWYHATIEDLCLTNLRCE